MVGKRARRNSSEEPLCKEVEFVEVKTKRLGRQMKTRPARHSSSPSKTSRFSRNKRKAASISLSPSFDALSLGDVDDISMLDVEPVPEPVPELDNGISLKAKKKKGSGKTQNQALSEWLPHRQEYLDEILMLEAPPVNQKCQQCKLDDFGYRCLGCFGHPIFCKTCCLQSHQRDPYHPIQRWDGECFVPATLSGLGLVVHLGHGGDLCPAYQQSGDQMDDSEKPSSSGGMGDGQDPNNSNWRGDDWEAVDDKAIWVVHTSGIFKSHIRYCQCSNAPDYHIQLLRLHLFPTSLVTPQTAFTFDALDQFEIDAMECKTSAMNFFNKLRRQTNNAFPHKVPDRYRELMRISRIWRDLQTRKRFGFGHDRDRTPTNGDLALFCPSCPQPGINLPEGWEKKPNQWLYRRTIVVDGNFSAEHMKMKRPKDDVWLSDGMAYVVEDQPYQNHLKKTMEVKQKSTCSNHRAVNQANANRHNLDATGIGACACSRHGCFIPHTVVDFQKGERQMNIDYAVCHALCYQTKGFKVGVVNYDVSCEWWKRFIERVLSSTTLSLPEKLRIIAGIGKFHLGGHVKSCFALHSLNFIQGAGQQDGEILETLWSSLNKVSGSIRAMSKAHRQEMLDAYMRDSNWKKLVKTVRALISKYKAAIEGRKDTEAAFKELDANSDKNLTPKWAEEERLAMTLRGEYLRIYDVRMEKAPSLAEIRLKLSENEDELGLVGGCIAWLNEGLNIEKNQLAICGQLYRPKKALTLAEKTDIYDKRARLQSRIDIFNQKAELFLSQGSWDQLVLEKDGWGYAEDAVKASTVICNIEVDDGEYEEEVNQEQPEHATLYMPSTLGWQQCSTYGWRVIADQERKLRIGQADESLEKLRLALGHKSLLLRGPVRHASGQRTGNRAWSEVAAVGEKVRKEVATYHRARDALVSLGANDVLSRYQPIQPEDVKMSGDMVEENRIGQRNDVLAWFWRLDGARQNPDDEWMNEFYRVNWLRAKARYDRWSEEVQIIQCEMDCTIRWFAHQQHKWELRVQKADGLGMQGHRSYAKKQTLLWKKMGLEAEEVFRPYIGSRNE